MVEDFIAGGGSNRFQIWFVVFARWLAFSRCRDGVDKGAMKACAYRYKRCCFRHELRCDGYTWTSTKVQEW